MMTAAQPHHQDERLWRMLKALGNPVRLEIVRFVRQRPGCICNEIMLQLPHDCCRAQSTLSQHLKILRDADVLHATAEGNGVAYTVNEPALAWLSEHVGHDL